MGNTVLINKPEVCGPNGHQDFNLKFEYFQKTLLSHSQTQFVHFMNYVVWGFIYSL